jgi:hypothetical protein
MLPAKVSSGGAVAIAVVGVVVVTEYEQRS